MSTKKKDKSLTKGQKMLKWLEENVFPYQKEK